MTAHRYWRLNIYGTHVAANQVAIGSMELRSVSGGTNLALSGGGTASASSNDLYSPDAAFDNSVGTYWRSAGAPTQWLQWDFGVGNAQDIAELILTNHNAASTDSSVKSGELLCSDDATSWTSWTTFSDRPYANSASSTHTYVAPPYSYAELTGPLASVAGFSGGAAPLSAPALQASGYSGGVMALLAPVATLDANGGANSALTGPSPTLYAAGHDSTGEQAAALITPSAILSAYAGANSALIAPPPTLGLSATVTNWGSAALAAPTPVISASGTVTTPGSASLTAPMASLIGYSGAVCSITLTGSPTLLATGTTGSIGGAALTCPLFELSASGANQNYGSANLLAPAAQLGATAQAWIIAPMATLTAIGSAVVTATYEAYAINLNHTPRPGDNTAPVDEMTRYTNFPFAQIVRYQNSYFGVAADGLYLLEGTTDNAVPISYAVKTATTDFKSPMQKTVASAYLAGRLGADTAITLYAGEGAVVQPYAYNTPRGVLAQNHRQAFGKGIKAHRYYALGLAGTGELALDSLELDTHDMKRRV